jgi:hypothetical protein
VKRSLRPGILLTVGAVAGSLGCSGIASRVTDGQPEIGNPPRPPREVKATFPTPPFAQYAVLEPRDENGRLIHHGGGRCWVELPFAETPTSWQPPPTEAVACPPEFSGDQAYRDCEYGEVHLLAVAPKAECVCYFTGNPPPSPKEIDCPTVTFPVLNDPGPPPLDVPIGRNPPATNSDPGAEPNQGSPF